MWRTIIPGLLVFNTLSHVGAQLPTNGRPEWQIRFSTAAEAEVRREKLVHYIWPEGRPVTCPAVTPLEALPPELPRGLVGVTRRVERLEVNVGGWDYQSIVLLLYPRQDTQAHRLVLVHQGHTDLLVLGVERAVHHFLEKGVAVAVLHMPCSGWNTDRDGKLPDGTEFHFGSRGTAGHNGMFEMLASKIDGQMFRFFLEPVVQTINYFESLPGANADVSMIGLSGGGWTTSMAAAVDPRIRFSAPVAGSAPIYVRNQDPSSMGDAEQVYQPLYNENIAEDGTGGGVATWLEIYALGGAGQGRRQVMVTNQFDTCCFAGHFADSFKAHVAAVVTQLGAGTWEHVLDSMHRQHKISSHILNQVLAPAMGIPAWTGNNLPVDDDFSALASPASILPAGWARDSKNRGDITMKAGNAVLQGTSSTSIISLQTFDPRYVPRLVCDVKFSEIGPGSTAGVFITDDPFSRKHRVGVYVNRMNHGIYVNADNGSGFHPEQDQLEVGKLVGYRGGPLQLTLDMEPEGFTVRVQGDAEFSSEFLAWSEIPGNFALHKLGDAATVCVQVAPASDESAGRALVRGVSVSVPTED